MRAARRRRRRPAAAGIPDCRRPPPPAAARRAPGRPGRRCRRGPLRAARRAGSSPALSACHSVGVDQQRHVAQRPGPLRARRVLVDAVEHAGVAQVPVGRGEAPVDLRRARARRASAGTARQCSRTRPSASIISSKLPGSGVIARQDAARGPRPSATRCRDGPCAPSNLSRPPQVERHREFQRALLRRDAERSRAYGRAPRTAPGAAPRPRRN